MLWQSSYADWKRNLRIKFIVRYLLRLQTASLFIRAGQLSVHQRHSENEETGKIFENSYIYLEDYYRQFEALQCDSNWGLKGETDNIINREELYLTDLHVWF